MKILIVEDNPDSRLVLQKTLEGAGYEVEAAVHGEDALAKAHASVPDLIISDILMPVMDGYKLCYAVKHDEKLRKIPFVFYTATYVDSEDERLAMGLGASRFIVKPMDPAQFMEVITQVIEEARRNELPVPEEPVDEPVELFRRFDASLSRKLEEKVRELELYRRVFDNSSEAIAVVGVDDTISRINQAQEKLLGYGESEILGKSPALYMDDRSMAAIRSALAEAGVAQGEGEVRTLSGHSIQVLYAVFPVKDEQDHVISFVWVLHDITKRIKAEKQQKLFRTLVNYSNDAIFVINPETAQLEDVNERACNRLQYSYEELVNRTALDIDKTFTTMELWQAHVDQLREEGVLMFESTYRRRDGSEFPVEISVVYTTTADGDYLIAVARNITERKKAEELLAVSRQEWERTFDAINEVVTLQDQEMRIIRANKAAAELFQKPFREIIGKYCYELFRENQEPCQGCPVTYSCEHFMPYSTEIEYPNLHKFFQVTAVPIIGTSGRVESIAHFAKDITEQKQLAAQLMQAQKMEAVGKLAGGVAHDFNNLLTAIQGYLELALLRFAPDDPVTVELHQVMSAAKRAANLVRQLLLFSRKQPMEFVVIDLNSGIEDLLKMLRRMIGEDIRLEMHLAPDCWKIVGDGGNIDQVVMNLAVNARDAMLHGGTLAIRTENMTLDEEYCRRNPEARPGCFVRLVISDTGLGMSEQVRQRIFEPFFTTKGLSKGTGLGLAVVYGIVKSHKGWITVYSEPGLGTTFKIYLPAASGEAATRSEVKVKDLEKFRGHGERILVVEDEEAIRNLTQKSLEHWGYEVQVAADAETALEMIGARKQSIDLILCDVVLPGMNGVDLVEQLRAKEPRLAVVLCSGYADQHSHWPKIQASGFPFLEKPFTIAQLLQILQRALQ